LYPFESTIARPDVTAALAVENIDIGGPAMIRSAAKNHADVLVVIDPNDYEEVLGAIAAGGSDFEFRHRFAAKAFAHTAGYDAAISAYLGNSRQFPDRLTLQFDKREQLRYGENPHQVAALYA